MKYCESCPKLHAFCEIHGSVNLSPGGLTKCKDKREFDLYENAPTFAKLEEMAKEFFLKKPDVLLSTWQTCQHAALLSLYKQGTVIENDEERAITPDDKVSVLYSGDVLERYVEDMSGVLKGVTIANTVNRIRTMFSDDNRAYYQDKYGIAVKGLKPIKVDGRFEPFEGYSEAEWEALMDFGFEMFQRPDKRFYLLWFLGTKIGLRWSDMMRIKPENIVKCDGRMYVINTAKKNKVTIRTPIHPDDWRMVRVAIEEIKKMRIHRVSAKDYIYLLRCNKNGNKEWGPNDRNAGAWLHTLFNKELSLVMGWKTGKKAHRLRKMGACRMMAITRDVHSTLAWLGDKNYKVVEKSYIQRLQLPESFEGLK